ncbi:type II toxin-antitoxin system HicB family antitoxin [Celeribacter halophilus]|uniref:type II toxin-antitoxin system HicB family antitoxin n=1 Tax=Celeribacter halophilus TaxID=576117 RepID=UPI003A91799E
MNVHDYFAFVTPLSVEDGGGFVAYVPDLPGCMGDGDTAESAIADAYNAAEAWIETANELGREIPAPGTAAVKAREREQSMIKALQAALDMQNNIDERITDLEYKIQHLIDVMSSDARTVSYGAIKWAMGKQTELCH